MNENENGGPAFPHQPLGSDGLPQCQADTGMSLRDYFAAAALTGLTSFTEDHAAREAYIYADAMLAERAKRQEGTS